MFRRWGASIVGIVLAVTVGVAPAAADPIRDRQYWLTDYGVTTAWATSRGAGVTVAVIDTGVDGSHPDLSGAVVGGMDASGVGRADGQRPVGAVSPEHGTMVASLLAGRGASGGGVIGVAPEANILSLSVGFGVGATDSDEQIARAVRWAADHGAQVINMSLTRNTLDWPESWDEAFGYAMSKDVVIVAAAGNRSSGTTQVGAPATMPGVLTVAGVDRKGSASFNASSQGISISVAAPSEELVGATPGGGYAEWGGTSGATPLVAGVVALVRSAHPHLSAGNVINRITSTARAVPGAGSAAIYGNGLVDAAAAVAAHVSEVSTSPAEQLQEWVRVYRRADAPDALSGAVEAFPAPMEPPSSVAPPVPPPSWKWRTAFREIGIPVAFFTFVAASTTVWVVWVVRSFRRRGASSRL